MKFNNGSNKKKKNVSNLIAKGGSRCSKPSRGGLLHDVTNLRNAARSRLSKSFSRMSHNLEGWLISFTNEMRTKNFGKCDN
jgi:hypothetical protein